MGKNTYEKENLREMKYLILMNKDKLSLINRERRPMKLTEEADSIDDLTNETLLKDDIEALTTKFGGEYMMLLGDSLIPQKAVIIGVYKNNKLLDMLDVSKKNIDENHNPRSGITPENINFSTDSYGLISRYMKFKN